MDLSSLEVALPAEVAKAVGTNPQGITAALVILSKVRQPSEGFTVRGWLRPGDDNPVIVAQRPGVTLIEATYTLRLGAADQATIDLQSWGDQVLEHFNGRARPPGIAKMRVCAVTDLLYDENIESTPGGEMAALLTFSGWRDK